MVKLSAGIHPAGNVCMHNQIYYTTDKYTAFDYKLTKQNDSSPK